MTTAERDASPSAPAQQRRAKPLRCGTHVPTRTPLCARARFARQHPATPLPYEVTDEAGEAAGDVECIACHRIYWSGQGHALYPLCPECMAAPNAGAYLYPARTAPAAPPANDAGEKCGTCDGRGSVTYPTSGASMPCPFCAPVDGDAAAAAVLEATYADKCEECGSEHVSKGGAYVSPGNCNLCALLASRDLRDGVVTP